MSRSFLVTANSVSLLARYVVPDGKVQGLIQFAANAGSMTFPPAVALVAQSGLLGVRRIACAGQRHAKPCADCVSTSRQVEAFLWVAAACAAVDILLVLFVQAAGERSLKTQAAAALA